MGILIFGALVLVLMLLFFLLTTREFETDAVRETKQMTVVSLSYTPSRTSTGVGPVIGGNGGVTVLTSTTSESNVVVLRGDHETLRIDDRQLFDAVTPGEKVAVKYFDVWRRWVFTQKTFWHEVAPCMVNDVVILGCVR